MIRIGVLGVGHLGKIHLKCLAEVPAFSLVGFYDPDEHASDIASSQFNLQAFKSAEDLMDSVDALVIVSTTHTHFDLAVEGIMRGKHLFIEKPVTENTEQVDQLIELARPRDIQIQVGHVERFNPAYQALKDLYLDPKFIEGHRLAMFNPRGTDVSVVQDLMIHDLDLLLHIVESDVQNVEASGIAVVSPTPDICNARITFKNGCVANLTASRISLKNMRKMRLFQSDAYISMDFLEKNVEVVRIYEQHELSSDDLKSMVHLELEIAGRKKIIVLNSPDCTENNAIQDELENFAMSISEGKEPVVTLAHAKRALHLAQDISKSIEDHLSRIHS